VEAGLTDGQPVTFAGNRLALIVPADNPARIVTPADLAGPGVRIIAAGDHVPITRYATQVVNLLARQRGYPTNFAAAYAANVVTKEDNVSAVVAKIELGEGDAAVVYATDAAASSAARTIEIPAASNVTTVYAGVVVKASDDVAAAHEFLDWTTGPEAQRILADLGFTTPPV
jgi:molybdate transport system substrate-binding protein